MADPDAPLRAALRRHKLVATGLLVLMAVLVLASHALPPGNATEFLRAAATAGLVGGLADWFAVTALFRRPLGLPIPHTAIIPAQKLRLGRALGNFVANHVITEAELSRVLATLDLPRILARFLADPASTRPAAEALASLLPRLLASIEDGRARKVAARIIPRLLGGPDAGRLVGRALRQLVEGGRHQDVFTFILTQLKALLQEREGALQAAIEERVREQGGRLIGWALGASIARRVLGQVNAEFAKMEPGDSDLRAAFDEWIRREIGRIESEPERAAEIGAALRRVASHETVRAWVWDVWSRLRLALEADAARPNGRTIAVIEGALANVGALLTADPAARARVQRAVAGISGSLLPSAQAQLADFIADVVGNWDEAVVVDKLELRVGRDLQFVRINGTLVGFLVGGLLFALGRGLFGGG
jgi:uncharacterized membrane-anchored protein YjiN (DUF445 family)